MFRIFECSLLLLYTLVMTITMIYLTVLKTLLTGISNSRRDQSIQS
jgi:hypothetical protein